MYCIFFFDAKSHSFYNTIFHASPTNYFAFVVVIGSKNPW